MVGKGKAEEEDAGDESQDRAKEGEARMRVREGGQNEEREVVDDGRSDGREGMEGLSVRKGMEIGAGRRKKGRDGRHCERGMMGGEEVRACDGDDVVGKGKALGLACRKWLAVEMKARWGQPSRLKVNNRLPSNTCTKVSR